MFGMFPKDTVGLTLKSPGFSESGKAGAVIPCVTSLFEGHEIWWCHTMLKALPGNNRTCI